MIWGVGGDMAEGDWDNVTLVTDVFEGLREDAE